MLQSGLDHRTSFYKQMAFTLERDSQVPLHAQILHELRQSIVTRTLAAGAAFPSERELAESYGVSRMTVRQALKNLRQEGLIYQERGIGSFVAKRKLDVHTRNLGGFSEEMRQRGFAPSSKILTLKKEQSDGKITESLGLKPQAEVFRLERLRLADEMPMAFETAFLPVALCPSLDDFNLEKLSLYQVLSERFGVEIHHAEEVLEAACADKNAAKTLNIKTGAPLLVVSRVVYTEANQAIESVKTIYRADRYRATFFLTKNAL
jgi:GntR family transcriptional regulator